MKFTLTIISICALMSCKLSPPQWILGEWKSKEEPSLLWQFNADGVRLQRGPYKAYDLKSGFLVNWHNSCSPNQYTLHVDHSFERVSVYHIFRKTGNNQLTYYKTYWPDSIKSGGIILQKVSD